MHVQSCNIASPKTIIWNEKTIETGIYKNPTPKPIFLAQNGVKDDFVADSKVHGGTYKACYLFSSDHYPYWKKLYPKLPWNWGMFGENLTVNGLNETQIMVGDVYRIGEALVQVTQPREPCFKFGVKFGTQHVLKQFIQHGFPGTYVRVIEEGWVERNDDVTLVNQLEHSLSITQLYALLFSKTKNQEHLKIAINLDVLPENNHNSFRQFLV